MLPTLKRSPATSPTAGFTLIELLVVVVMLGVLAALAAPSWQTVMNRQRVATAQRDALIAIREAQANTQRDIRPWQACFRTNNNRVEVLVHPIAPPNNPLNCPANHPGWRYLAGETSKDIQILAGNTNLPLRNGMPSVRFDFNGRLTAAGAASSVVVGNGERITFAPKNQSGPRRCVILPSILGVARSGRDADCN
ncbi:prepilin-type N-terminal cleavage/methylation domain-containing protein [Trichothermofontia sp.]